MPIREQGEHPRHPREIRKQKRREIKREVRRMDRHDRHKPKKHENQNKYENVTYSRTPIKESALKRSVKMAAKERMAGRQAGRQYADEVLSREYEGLKPAQRQALEEENNRQINRNVREADRELISNQGRRGVGGGAAFKQRRSLFQEGNREKQAFQRELTGLNADLAMKKL